jgi:hypothetical protein
MNNVEENPFIDINAFTKKVDSLVPDTYQYCYLDVGMYRLMFFSDVPFSDSKEYYVLITVDQMAVVDDVLEKDIINMKNSEEFSGFQHRDKYDYDESAWNINELFDLAQYLLKLTKLKIFL